MRSCRRCGWLTHTAGRSGSDGGKRAAEGGAPGTCSAGDRGRALPRELDRRSRSAAGTRSECRCVPRLTKRLCPSACSHCAAEGGGYERTQGCELDRRSAHRLLVSARVRIRVVARPRPSQRDQRRGIYLAAEPCDGHHVGPAEHELVRLDAWPLQHARCRWGGRPSLKRCHVEDDGGMRGRCERREGKRAASERRVRTVTPDAGESAEGPAAQGACGLRDASGFRRQPPVRKWSERTLLGTAGLARGAQVRDV